MGLGIGKFLKKHAVDIGLGVMTGGGSFGLTGLGKIAVAGAGGLLLNKVGNRINKSADIGLPETESILPAVVAGNAVARQGAYDDASMMLETAMRSGASPGAIEAIMRQNRMGAEKIAALSADRFLEAKDKMAERNLRVNLMDYNRRVQEAQERRRSRLGNLAAVAEIGSSLLLDKKTG